MEEEQPKVILKSDIMIYDYNEILEFWFGNPDENNIYKYHNGLWWYGIYSKLNINSEYKSNKQELVKYTDNLISNKWGKLLELYHSNYLFDGFDFNNEDHPLKTWLDNNDGIIALIILFDQFSRRIYRGTNKAYEFDKYIIKFVKDLLKTNIEMLPITYKIFINVVLMHSENILDVENASFNISTLTIKKTTNLTESRQLLKLLTVINEHYDILKKFGRYPNMNNALGRSNTIEENDFLLNKNLPKWIEPSVILQNKIKKSITLDNNENNKLRILVLHGNRQNGEIFKTKTKRYLEKKLNHLVELVYADAPKLYEPSSEIKLTISAQDYVNMPIINETRSWWSAGDDEDTMIYNGLEESIMHIDNLFQNNKFEGIIGFSQGGALTGIISSLVNAEHLNINIPVSVENIAKSLKFVVIISAFSSRDTRPEFIEILKQPINIPSFHIWGKNDTLVDPWRSELLSSKFTNKVIHVHQSSHFIKAIKYWPIIELTKWIESFTAKNNTLSNYDEIINLDIYKKISSNIKINNNDINELEIQCLKIATNKKTVIDKLLLFIIHKNMDVLNLLTVLYDDNNELIIQKISELISADNSSSVWKHLIEIDSLNINNNIRPILVKLISDKLNEDYIKYYINKSTDGIPSNLVLIAPRYNVLYRKTRLYHDIALNLALIINIFNNKLPNICEDNIKRQTILSYNQYGKIISRLHNILIPLNVKVTHNIKKRYTEEDLPNLLLSPLSDYIINPKAEPVDISPEELFDSLYEYLQNEQDKKYENIEFSRGTICTDGRLDLCKQVVGPTGVEKLFRALKDDSSLKNPKVRHLLLGNSICGNNLAFAIAKFIESGQSGVNTWYIGGNNIDEYGIEAICCALAHDKQIKQIWFKRNTVRFNGIKHIALMFQTNKCLEVLDLTNTGIMDDGAVLLLNNISQTLRYLYLASNGLTYKTCMVLTEMLHTCKLEQIALGCNRLGNDGVKFIAQSLEHKNCYIKSIELASCGIGSSGAKYIADALLINTSLIHLNLGYLKSTADLCEIQNIISSTGASYLAKSLLTNKTLCALDLVHNGILQTGISAFADTLIINKTLIYLNIDQFGIPNNELSREIIRKSVRKNKELTDPDQIIFVNNIMFPSHLNDIQSVYRNATLPK